MMKTSVCRLASTPIDLGDLRILGLGLHEQIPEGMIHRPHGLEGYLFAFFPDEITLSLHSVAQRVPPQHLIIWKPDSCQHFGNAMAPWEYSWVHADGPFVQELLESLAIPDCQMLALPKPSCVEDFLWGLHQECTQYLSPHPIIVHNLLQNWLVEAQRLATTDASRQLPAWAVVTKQYMESHFDEPITLEQMAEQVHFSVGYFCRLFNNVFGMAPLKYLTDIRIRMAKYLLLDDNLSISDIAGRTGYANFSHFTALFRRYYGVSPREMRKGMSGEAGRRRRTEERQSRELERWLHEGWQVALDLDFTRATSLDPRVRGFLWHEEGDVPEMTAEHVKITDGVLRLCPTGLWSGIVWEGELNEETKVEVVAVNATHDGLNLAIAISGNLQYGYRLRLVGYEDVVLETTINGYWEILHRCHCTLDPHACEYHITFWRAANVFYAELEGRRILEYDEPFAPQGDMHHCFAIARMYTNGSAELRALRVCTRITPRYVDILEPGRVLLRAGHRQEAATWFQRVVQEHPDAVLQQEAAYLMALAVPDTDREAKERAFRQVIEDPTSPFHQRLLRQWVLTRCGWGDLTGAVEMALVCAARYPEDHTPHLLAEKSISHLRGAAPSEVAQTLATLARLPLRHLNLGEIIPASFAPLQGMALKELWCAVTTATDLSPLQGMPLESLTIHHSAITTLAPLAEMPLRHLILMRSRLHDLLPLCGTPLQTLACPITEIADLSPLAGMPLQSLECYGNHIQELAPLRGMPLRELYCSGNCIQELAPLRGMPLIILNCAHNQIAELTPLAGMPLQHLACAGNRITEISPLHGMPLTTLDCQENAIADLSPLAGLPLRSLTCRENPLTSLAPLRGMAIEDLEIDGIPYTADNLRVVQAMPLQHLAGDLSEAAWELLHTHDTLEGMNHHSVAYVRAIYPLLRQAVTAWRDAVPEDRPALEQYATACGTARYLALPIRMTRQEAEAFSRYYGGMLACPATSAHYQALHAYLLPLLYHGRCLVDTAYHLGLVYAPALGTFHWLSGAAYQWQQWFNLLDQRPRKAGTACFLPNQTLEGACWQWYPNPSARLYVVIEWPANGSLATNNRIDCICTDT